MDKLSYYDLKLEASTKRLLTCVGRSEEILRLTRIVSKQVQNNALVVGPGGIGKTTFLHGWASASVNNKAVASLAIVSIESTSLERALSLPPAGLIRYQEALSSLPPSVVVLDSFGLLLSTHPSAIQNLQLLLKPLLENKSVRVIAAVSTKEYEHIKQHTPNLLEYFETLTLEEQPKEELAEIIKLALKGAIKHFEIPDSVFTYCIDFCKRFPSLGQLPRSAIGILDESIAEAAARNVEVSNAVIDKIVAEKTGVPVESLNRDEKDKLKNLHLTLKKSVIGQDAALESIAGTIIRAKLGLKNRQRPLGSFLLLGPSGVGKTETAKTLAEQLFGKADSFLRIDMSEFSEAHASARLIGSPPGYVGFDAGGQLTNQLQKNPYSLILLDEIEKAHPKIFDIFLQLLDDGRLTSGQGETVDGTNSVIVATSNLGVAEIISHYEDGVNIGHPNFIRQHLMPILSTQFRTEFLNRFDTITAYKPLSIEDLTNIAMLEIQKIEKRASVHNIRFNITPEILREKIKELRDPRLGARPVKRFVEEVCEGLIAKQLLQ